MRADVIARNADHLATGLHKSGVKVTKLLRFGSTARCAVLGVKINDEDLLTEIRKRNVFSARRRQAEFRDGLVDHAGTFSCQGSIVVKKGLPGQVGWGEIRFGVRFDTESDNLSTFVCPSIFRRTPCQSSKFAIPLSSTKSGCCVRAT